MNSPKTLLIFVLIFAFDIRVPLDWYQDYNCRFNTNETIWGCYLTLSLCNALKCMTGDEDEGSVASINECTTKLHPLKILNNPQVALARRTKCVALCAE